MLKLSCRFDQSEFRRTHYPNASLQGLCFALCAQWCSDMNQDVKNMWGNPNTPAHIRMQKFTQHAEKIKRVQEYATAFSDHLSRKFEHLQHVTKALSITEKSGFLESSDNIRAAVIGAIRDYRQMSDTNVQKVIGFFNNHVGSVQEINSLEQLMPHLMSRTCYIIIIETGIPNAPVGQHAIAAYVSGGVFNYDYHVFDPNTGEFKASGANDLIDLFSRIQRTYFPQKLRYCSVS